MCAVGLNGGDGNVGGGYAALVGTGVQFSALTAVASELLEKLALCGQQRPIADGLHGLLEALQARTTTRRMSQHMTKPDRPGVAEVAGALLRFDGTALERVVEVR